MAQQLQQQGQEVALLAIMDTPAPIHAEIPEPIDDARWLVKRAQVLERFFRKKLSVDLCRTPAVGTRRAIQLLFGEN